MGDWNLPLTGLSKDLTPVFPVSRCSGDSEVSSGCLYALYSVCVSLVNKQKLSTKQVYITCMLN